tara:strand:+ start:2226 stop:2543 length:318 start_codon:yes stop_codon:yes gene_type:complete
MQLSEAFNSKAAQKRALKDVNCAFALACDTIKDWCVDQMERCVQSTGERGLPEVEELYFALPMYPHQWRAKHEDIIRLVYPESEEAIDLFNGIIGMHKAIKTGER